VAVERDPYWASRLKRRVATEARVQVLAEDGLSASLPSEPFRVVANVPFHTSTAILHRLLDDPAGSPELVHALVQKEVARKHSKAAPTTLKALTWAPWWRFAAGSEVPAFAFDPEPGVDARLLVAAKRDPPLVVCGQRELFQALVRAAFNGRGNAVGKVVRPFFTRRQIRRLANDNGFSASSFPPGLTVHQWAAVFGFMVRAAPPRRWPAPHPRSTILGRRPGSDDVRRSA
jgi:23S rRNA (adenine-N6)-dimethyltransferase